MLCPDSSALAHSIFFLDITEQFLIYVMYITGESMLSFKYASLENSENNSRGMHF